MPFQMINPEKRCSLWNQKAALQTIIPLPFPGKYFSLRLSLLIPDILPDF